jgi:copper(I)-binding protein
VNRALRAATVGVLLVSPVALSACSAGQVNQTATQLRDKVGPSAQIGTIELRAVKLAYPSAGSYSAGDDAELSMAIVNDGDTEDVLTDISGTGFSSVRVTGSASGTAAPASPGASGSAAAEGEIPVPADSVVYLGQNAQTVTLVDLDEELLPTQTLELTFTFEEAGEVSLEVPVAAPSREVARGEAFDFHEEENEGEETNTEVSGGVATQREEGEGEG